jgi:hypothetical protein
MINNFFDFAPLMICFVRFECVSVQEMWRKCEGVWGLVCGLINEMLMKIVMIHGRHYYRLYFYSKPNAKCGAIISL